MAAVPPEELEDDPHRGSSEVPLGRMAEPEEIGRVIVFLCSDGASFITGTSVAWTAERSRGDR